MKFICDKKYMVFPIGHIAQKKKLKFLSNAELVFDLDIELDYIHPDYRVYIDVERFIGMEIDLICVPEIGLTIELSDEKHPDGDLYAEKYRPLFHFSSQNGWINDPNGLVYYDGNYHLFYQHNPAGCKWGNMHWGHAVSKDLLHWEEQDCALVPDGLGTEFSGSAIIDKKNAAGLKCSDNDVMVLFYTAAGGTSALSQNQPFTQCMAYSTDGGKTFQKYAGNPVVQHIEAENRDPKVFYHKPSDRYFMILYLNGNRFALLESKNLLDWKNIQEITVDEEAECPDLYPLKADESGNEKWVITGASDRYIIGDFDGTRFEPQTDVKMLHYGHHSYAAQTWSNIDRADGRMTRVAWNRFEFPFMPFNNSMTFPCEMSCKLIQGEWCLCTEPIRDIEYLYTVQNVKEDIAVTAGNPFTAFLKGKAYDITLEIADCEDAEFELSVFGFEVACSLKNNQLACLGKCAPLHLLDGKVKLRLLIDVTGVELFLNEGSAYMCNGFLMDYNLNRFEIRTKQKEIRIDQIKTAEIGSVWNQNEQK